MSEMLNYEVYYKQLLVKDTVIYFSRLQLLLLLLLLLLLAAPIQGLPQQMFVKHLHRRFGSVLHWMPFLMQPTDGRET